ncbi:putative subtilisin-like serine protease [Ceratobasidium sp. AG-I]|nr:putative subtilisin-like serine protease [Ceratobasidium sp. AG-I]
MKFTFATAAAVLVIPAFAAPTALPIIKLAGPTRSDSYIVKLKDGVSKDSHIAGLVAAIGSQDSKVVYKYEDVFNGYAGVFKGLVLDFVRRSSDVEYIQADTIYQIEYEEGDEALATREVETSNLVSRTSNGKGVTVFGMDTGINTAHTCFGGRASWGATFGGYADTDGNGHGTHTAGTAVGGNYGPATSAKIVAVKVCSDSGSCASSDIIAGINYIILKAKGPTVATMSLGGGADPALDSVVSVAISRGIHFTIAAGNSNVDAGTTSPARVNAANTIGAIDSSDRKASFSNYGPVVDVWALGVHVLSAWIGSTTAVNTISGTSMATPAVAGILAVALGEYGNAKPSKLSAALKSHATPVVIGAPSGTTNLKAMLW